MASFVLLHGGGHRAWHWHLVEPILERLGHGTIALEVPMDDPNAGAAAWADVIVKQLAGRSTEDVVVVGHSLAGLVLPLIGARVPVRRLVYLCANVPVPGRAYSDYMAENPDATIVPWERLERDESGRNVVPWDLAREVFYPDCDEPLAREAFAHLVPVATTAFTEPCPLEKWPVVRSTYILCTEDKVNGPEWAREVSVARLGGPALELPGSHSPFLSRPEHLAAVLGEVAACD